MKQKQRLVSNFVTLITFAGFFTHGGVTASAATRTWDGSSGGDWNDAINWSDDTKPVAGDTAVFNTNLAAVTSAVADQSILNIQFGGAAGTGAGTLNLGTVAGNSLILGNGGAVEMLSSLTGTGKVISINSPVVLTPESTTTDGIYSLLNNSADATNGLQFKGTIQASTTSGVETLVLSGSNTGLLNVITGTISNGGAGALALHKTGSGRWTIKSYDNPVNNSFSGGTTISGGTLEVNSLYNQAALGTGLLTFDGGTLLATGFAPTLFNNVVVNSVSGNTVTTPTDLQIRGNITGSGTLTHHLSSFASLNLYGNNSGFTGTYVQDADGSFGWTYFHNTASGSPNASWVVNNRGLAANVPGGTTIRLGSLASTNVFAQVGNFGGGSLTFVLGENNASTTFDGRILNLSGPGATAGGTTAIVKEGSGTLLITNINNNYSGGTTINAGKLGTNNSKGWGATFGSGPITLNGGTLLADASASLPNQIIVNDVAGNAIDLGIRSASFAGNFTGSGDVFLYQTGGGWTNLNGDNSGYSGTITADASMASNLLFGPTATSDAASWVLNCAGVVGGNSSSGSQTLNFGSLAGTNPNTRIGDGNNSSTLVRLGANNETTAYAGRIVNAWFGSGTTRVTKVGTGTQTLSGALNYKGNTVVVDGVLSITSPNFDDASTVTIGLVAASPAVLDLPTAGTDTVASLIIDGVTQVSGKVYGNSSSVLPVVATSAITGPGRIQVGTVVVSDYDTWISAYPSITGDDKLPTADPDNDGLTNQQEFAFGLVPNSGSSVNPILVPLDKTTGTFTYQRRVNTGLTYRILTSPDLTSWPEDVPATSSQVAGAVDGNGNQTVVVTLTGTKPLSDAKRFVRVAAQ